MESGHDWRDSLARSPLDVSVESSATGYLPNLPMNPRFTSAADHTTLGRAPCSLPFNWLLQL